MTDFLLSTPSLVDFHTANLRHNPSHYPFLARLIGAAGIARLTEAWGAGVWYVTMVHIRDLVSARHRRALTVQEVKYGVISTDRLKCDLEGWETLYVAGRLHKPVRSPIPTCRSSPC
jgi:translocator assembly and maintenance protein 41